MNEQKQTEPQNQEQQPPTIGGLVQPSLNTFNPVPESAEEREQLEQELSALDSPAEREAPASEDEQP